MKNLLVVVLGILNIVGFNAQAKDYELESRLYEQQELTKDSMYIFLYDTKDPVAIELADLLIKIQRDYSNDMAAVAEEASAKIFSSTSGAEKDEAAKVIAFSIARITFGTHRLISGILSSEKNRILLTAENGARLEKFLAELKKVNNYLIDEGLLLIAASDSRSGKDQMVADTDPLGRTHHRIGGFSRGVMDGYETVNRGCMSRSIENTIGSFALPVKVICMITVGGVSIGLLPLAFGGIVVNQKLVEMTADSYVIKTSAEAAGYRIN